jgi:hypothetical protein
VQFAEKLEKVYIETVGSRFMTCDLAILISLDQPCMDIQALLAEVDKNINEARA